MNEKAEEINLRLSKVQKDGIELILYKIGYSKVTKNKMMKSLKGIVRSSVCDF